MMKIHNTTFSGTNLDGSNVVDLAAPTSLVMNGWHCIGPAFYGRATWRQRLAWWLLGLRVQVRMTGVRYEGQMPMPPSVNHVGLRIIAGGKD